MQRRLQGVLTVGVCLASISAAAEQPATEIEAPPRSDSSSANEESTDAPKRARPLPPDTSDQAKATAGPAAPPSAWRTEISGYLRAPMILSMSSRPGPDTPTGPSRTQVSFSQNRTLDWSYFSFAYTRLEEQDWAELFVHERTDHVEAVVGWMGYWYQAAGFRNPDAAWLPGAGYVSLDTDLGSGERKSNLSATVGAWWPKFGYMEKYDTYTLGRFRQLGEQLT